MGVGEEPGDDGDGDGADGEVDVEAPAPSNFVGEDAAEERARDRGDAEHGAYHARVEGTAVEWDGIGEDDEGAREETCCADACDGAPDDEGYACVGDAADEGADFENEDGD